MQSDPTSAYSNYYSGYSWQKLSPADRAKFGTAQQAKAVLKKAAQKALQVAMLPR